MVSAYCRAAREQRSRKFFSRIIVIMARAMITMIKERDLRLRCSHTARQYAETILSPERYINKVVACYESMRRRA